jgi:uncharacterized protein YciI
MRRQRIVVRVRAGPTWADGGPPEVQPGWDEHEAFVDALVDQGTIVMGGPLSDYSGSIVILEGITRDDARALMDKDPFVRNGVFMVEDIKEWTVYVDSLTKP